MLDTCHIIIIRHLLHEIMALEMTNSNSSSQVKEQYYSSDDIKSKLHILDTHYPQAICYGFIFERQCQEFSTSAKPWLNQQNAVTSFAKLSGIRVVDGKEMKWFIVKERIR
jgi:hypothetical protein